MVTFFSSLRPFVDPHTTVIQRNAIKSWLALTPRPEVLLIGDDAGVAEIAREFSVEHIPHVEKDNKGLPMRSSMCHIANAVAQNELLCIINSDIVVLDHFYHTLSDISLTRFVATGRRYDLDVDEEIAMDNKAWRSILRGRIHRDGKLRGPSAMDYAVYPKSISPPVLPPFPVNSFGWDPWFLYAHHQRGIPVVNITQVATIVHQNHESSDDVRRKRKAWLSDATAMAALRKVGGFSSMITLREADYVLTPTGLQRPLPNRIMSGLAGTKGYRLALGLKRETQRALFR